MSTDLQWALIGRNNKFMQVRNGIRLSSDPLNNNGKYTKRHSGFVQQKAAVVKMNGKTGKVYVAVNDGANQNKPKSMFKTVTVGTKASEASKAVSVVRPDLADVAFRKARKLTKSAHKVATVRAASKARSAKRTFKRTAKRTSKKEE